MLSASRENKVNSDVFFKNIPDSNPGSEIIAKAKSEPGFESEINAKAGSESGAKIEAKAGSEAGSEKKLSVPQQCYS